jgi:adenylate cyclase
LIAFSHYLLGQYDAALSWAREALYLNPVHLQVLAVRAAASRLLVRQNSRALSSLENASTPAHVAPFSWKTISAPAESSSRCNSLGGEELTCLRP